MEKISQAVVAFVVAGFLMVGFFLIIPGTYDRINAEDLGVQGNQTLDTTYSTILGVESVFGFVFLVLGVLVTVLVAYTLVAGRR
jgi:hypothetical protein